MPGVLRRKLAGSQETAGNDVRHNRTFRSPGFWPSGSVRSQCLEKILDIDFFFCYYGQCTIV